ncbi:hypothetical protein TNCV_1885781 [Trichonephila clavipes]|nr:hypothetical protein TNCV_1885781 [Trichonephila clavipes]
MSMQIVAKEAKDVSVHSDIPVAIDGTSQKHGHTSLNGAVIATSVDTGKVCLMLQFYQDFVSVPTKCIMRTVTLIILETVEVWKFQKPSKSSNVLKVCIVCDITIFWDMVTPERIKQLTRCCHMKIQVLKNWNAWAVSRNECGLDYEL